MFSKKKLFLQDLVGAVFVNSFELNSLNEEHHNELDALLPKLDNKIYDYGKSFEVSSFGLWISWFYTVTFVHSKNKNLEKLNFLFSSFFDKALEVFSGIQVYGLKDIRELFILRYETYKAFFENYEPSRLSMIYTHHILQFAKRTPVLNVITEIDGTEEISSKYYRTCSKYVATLQVCVPRFLENIKIAD